MQEYIKKLLGSGHNTTSIMSNDEMEDIIKKVKSLEDFRLLLLYGISETIKNEAKELKGGFFSILLGKLTSSLLRNMLACKGIVRAGYGSKGK